MRRWPLLTALVGLLAAPGSAPQAHLLNMTTIQVNVRADGDLEVTLSIDLTRASGGSLEYYRLSRVAQPLTDPEIRALLGQLAASVSVRPSTGEALPLQVVSAEFPKAPKDVFIDPLSWPMTQVVLHGRLPPRSPRGLEDLRAAFLPSFHFEEPIALTFMLLAEQRRMTRWLVTSQVSPPFPLHRTAGGQLDGNGQRAADPASTRVSLWQFVGFGFLHILPRGLDHVLFVLGLYWGARSLKSLVVLVTCFTLAHSITLGLASLGIIRLSPNVVEPLISASIAWVGIENLVPSPRTERYRPFLVFGFGLLHGLGFASALSALDTPERSFLPTLLSFNLGIELGQLTVIGGALILTAGFRTRPWYRTRIVLPASATIALIAVAWTVRRLV